MTAPGVCQQGKCVIHPPCSSSYHKIYSCNRENRCSVVPFMKKVAPVRFLSRENGQDVYMPDVWQPCRVEFG